MRLVAARLVAGLFALSWLLLPGFGLPDLAVSWDPAWPVVLEASWGVVMTVLVAGSFAAVAVRPSATAPAQVVLLVVAAAWVTSAVAAGEGELLGFTAFLAVEAGLLAALLPARERLRPVRWSVHRPLLALAVAGAVPWLVHAATVFRLNRANTYEVDGDITMGTDHYAMQGALALALVALTVLAACWPRGRRHLGVAAGIAGGYVGLVSLAHPGADAALGTPWSGLAVAWGAAVAVLSAAPRLQRGELRREVVEPE